MLLDFDKHKPYYQLDNKVRLYSFVFMAVGLLSVVVGFVSGQAERTFANLLMMSYYFVAVCIAGVVFCALQYIVRASWSVAILRVPHAFAQTAIISGVVFVIVVLSGLFSHNLYHHWSDPSLVDPASEHYDKIIAGKSAYLNVPFFIFRIIFLVGIYAFFGYLLVKKSEIEDDLGGVKIYKKNIVYSAIFIVLFAFTYPLLAFDSIMSLEAHWYSTMFAWYNFAGLWVSGLSAMAIVLVVLKEKGYFEWVTKDHLHDLGKLIFGFSIFWTYLWFCQFLLIYYANLPEETVYFDKRLGSFYKPIFFLSFFLCFLTPFLLFMSRNSKRHFQYVKWVCGLILVGHYFDYYIMIMPAVVGDEASFGFIERFIEIGSILLFVGLFIFTIFRSISRRLLVPKRHPLLEESVHHHQ